MHSPSPVRVLAGFAFLQVAVACAPLPPFFDSTVWKDTSKDFIRTAGSDSCLQQFTSLTQFTTFQGVCSADELQYPWIFAMRWYCALRCEADPNCKKSAGAKPNVVICHPFEYSQQDGLDPTKIFGQCECHYGLTVCRPEKSSLLAIQQNFADHCSACSPLDPSCRPAYFNDAAWEAQADNFARETAPTICASKFDAIASSAKFTGLCSGNDFPALFALRVVCANACQSKHCKPPVGGSKLEEINCGNFKYNTSSSTNADGIWTQCKCYYTGQPPCSPRSYSWAEIQNMFGSQCTNPTCETGSECMVSSDCGLTPLGQPGSCQNHQCCTDVACTESFKVACPSNSAQCVAGKPCIGTCACLDPIPSPDPDPLPSPSASPSPSPDPNPNPSPDPDPNPSADPNPNPSPDPNPNPSPDPDPNPSPDPDPNPSPDPNPNPSADPNPNPSPDPGPNPSPDPNPNPSPDPGPNPSPDPDPNPSADPNPNPSPDPNPNPSADPNPNPNPNPDPNPSADPNPNPSPGSDPDLGPRPRT